MVLIVGLIIILTVRGEQTDKEYHSTRWVNDRGSNLTCVHCNTTAQGGGEQCADLHHQDNNSNIPDHFLRRCPMEMRTCIVKRYSYTFSTENTTSGLRMWSLERNCSRNCEPGCIMIGERTKLYACTACCDTPNCNTGKGTGIDVKSSPLFFYFILIYTIISI